MLDILIRNATIIDGTGSPGYRGDVGIQADRIAFVGTASEALISQSKKIIDATGKAVCPGFIDCHTHSDLSLFTQPQALSRLYGGVTTDISGNCGIGVAPLSDEFLEEGKRYFLSMYPIQNDLNRPVFSWRSFGEYLSCLGVYPAAINSAALVSQGPVRIARMGFRQGMANPEELKDMQNMVAEAMEAGALGVSTGLNYLPGAFCHREELIEITKPAAKYGGKYISHIRTQSAGFLDSVEEAFQIARGAGVGAHISHMKLLGPEVWGMTDQLFERIYKARAEGLPVSFDAYPYNAGATGLIALLPHWTQEGGVAALMERLADPALRQKMRQQCTEGLPGWQNLIKSVGFGCITVSDVGTEKNQPFVGKTLREVAQMRQQDPFDALFDLLTEEQGQGSMVISHMDQKDVDTIITHPDCSIASDSASATTGKPHPRFYGTNGRIFTYYVRQKKLLTLEDAVRKMTSLPAQQFNIAARGQLKKDFYADILIFDPATIGDRATYDDPTQYSTGIDTILVNGQIVFAGGAPTGVMAGRVVSR